MKIYYKLTKQDDNSFLADTHFFYGGKEHSISVKDYNYESLVEKILEETRKYIGNTNEYEININYSVLINTKEIKEGITIIKGKREGDKFVVSDNGFNISSDSLDELVDTLLSNKLNNAVFIFNDRIK